MWRQVSAPLSGCPPHLCLNPWEVRLGGEAEVAARLSVSPGEAVAFFEERALQLGLGCQKVEVSVRRCMGTGRRT